jgi:error-prone DNA polymerase
MGWHNPPIPWSEHEKLLRDASRPGSSPPLGADAGDSPAWSAHRAAYQASVSPRETDVVEYAELHLHSSFSFLDGVSAPEKLVERAAQLGLSGLAITDHNGLYGVVRFAEAAAWHKVPTVFGAELSLGSEHSRTGVSDPSGSHLLVLARGEEGYHRLSQALTEGHLATPDKGSVCFTLDQLAEIGRDHWVILTGCRKGAVRSPLSHTRVPSPTEQDASERALRDLVDRFGPENVVLELIDQQHPLDSVHNDFLAELAARHGLPTVATGLVHYATVEQSRLAHAMAAVRARTSMDALAEWLPAAPAHYLRSGREQARRFARYPGAVSRSVQIAQELSFSLKKVTPGLPRSLCPPDTTTMEYLRELIYAAIPRRYPNATPKVLSRIEQELEVIQRKDFAGYFLIVHDIVRFARSRGILCQGRGSAANSAVCFLLDITAVDSIYYQLPFERFLSALRDEEPDIDVDFESHRREEVIQYVYQRYGRRCAAQVATVIEYRPKSAVRDMARALGYTPGQQDSFSRQIERSGALRESDQHTIPQDVTTLALQALTLPRHLGIHSGGMVLTDRPVSEVVPIEPASMKDRTIVQWDKDDCAWMGLVKFDLLGLGILQAIRETFDLAASHLGEHWELATLPRDEAGVYDMLCRADSIGVFQVESRAQMALLPRLQPRRFYDLAIQIAMIRPGPIQGGAVHPFVRRKAGVEAVVYPHPALEQCLERTLGVPVFQEQLMQIAMAVGGCSAEDADLLRRAMGSKRGLERIESLRETLYTGMAHNGLDQATADRIYGMIQAFANFGFAESHSLSFALLVYASAWLKLHYPALYLSGLLRAWPMGFYSPASLVADAERHGVEVRRPCVQRSGVDAGAEPLEHSTQLTAQPTGLDECLIYEQPTPSTDFPPETPDPTPTHRRDGKLALRLGVASVRGIGEEIAQAIVSEREKNGPYRNSADLVRRVGLSAPQLESLASAGALSFWGENRREALWMAGHLAGEHPRFLPHSSTALTLPDLEPMSQQDTMRADRVFTGVSPGDHPLHYWRSRLSAQGVLSVADLAEYETGRRVWVAGLITHRQRPATAMGVTFLNVEDETGLVNVICGVGFWKRHRMVLRDSSALIVRGLLERSPEGVISVVADGVETLVSGVPEDSRNFR